MQDFSIRLNQNNKTVVLPQQNDRLFSYSSAYLLWLRKARLTSLLSS